MTNNEISKAKKYIMESDLVIFDCIDTLIKRKYSPSYPFLIYAKYLIDNYNVDLNIKPLSNSLTYFLGDLRVNPIINFQKIYYHYGLSIHKPFDIFLEESITVFFNAEKNNCEPINGATTLLSFCKDNKKEMVLFSDYYLDSVFLKKILSFIFPNIAFSAIYCSSNLGFQKCDPFFVAFVNKNYSKKTLTIIDDNASSWDLDKKWKIITPRHSHNNRLYSSFNNNYSKNSKKNVLSHWIKNNNYYSTNYVYHIYDFSRKLYKSLSENDHVFFLAREGQFLKKCFDYYISFNNFKKITTSYLVVSRIAILLSTIEIENKDLDFIYDLIKKYSPIKINTVNDFISLFGITKDELDKLLGNNNFDHIQKDDSFFSQSFSTLWENKNFLQIIREKRLKSLSALKKKLSFNGDKYIFVDVGWLGTMQNFIGKTLNIRTKGFYLGTTYPKYISDKCDMIGLLFDYNNDNIYINNYQDMIILEAILRADHGQVIFYSKDNDIIVDDESLNTFNNFSKKIQEKIFDIFKKLTTLDIIMPIEQSLLYEIEHDVIKKKPLRTKVIERYYCQKQAYGSNKFTCALYFRELIITFKNLIKKIIK